MNSEIRHGDCRDVLRQFPDDYFDSCVTDPPYELTGGKKGGSGEASLNLDSPAGRSRISTGGGFMGKEWDSTGVAFDPATWREVFRVLRPGAHLAVFGGTRTYHRMAVAIEDAGFEIRDSLHWIYGSGFPKSLDVSKAIDKAAGAEREVTGSKSAGQSSLQRVARVQQGYRDNLTSCTPEEIPVTVPATDAAQQWDGWGTALKPAHEPVILARKPLAEKTVAANVLAHGTGALNIDGCRVATTENLNGGAYAQNGSERHDGAENWRYKRQGDAGDYVQPLGRFPPNILLTHSADCQSAGIRHVKGITGGSTSGTNALGQSSGWNAHVNRPASIKRPVDADGMKTIQAFSCVPGCPIAGLDGQSGSVGAAAPVRGTEQSAAVEEDAIYNERSRVRGVFHADSGGASRFFPQFTWDPLYDLPFMYCAKAPKKERPSVEGMASHPTVKPLALMRWLVRLITPPEGIVLDPFAGTGTTGQAARDEDFGYVLIEREPDYIKLINKRLYREPSLFDEFPEACV